MRYFKTFKTRFSALYIVVGLAALSVPLLFVSSWFFVLLALSGYLSIVGYCDINQKHSSVRRNYPILAHIRFFFEEVRPELRQYLIESDDEQVPFSRSQRSLVYARSKNEPAEKAFGSLKNMYEPGYEFIGHSIVPSKHVDHNSYRITIGGDQCKKPYSASIFNISAMSFGSLSANAILALNKGAAKGGFYHDTGEGSVSKYHLANNGDIIWEIGSGLFGTRDPMGNFCPSRFAEQAGLDNIKGIELKLSQGAKPGHGGILPSSKVTMEIAETRGISLGVDCISPASHSSFSTPIELMQFIQRLRDLSGGKPIGFKLAIGKPDEFMGICKAMLETGIRPDFIVVDGSEGGTGAAPREFTDHVGMPLREGVLFVHNTLVGCGLRDQIKIGASGKIISAFDIVRMLAIGADWVNSARGFMFALGCLQSAQCSTGHCVTGVATQDPERQKALDVDEKSERVYSFHKNTMIALSEMLAAAGVDRPSDLKPEHIVRRISATEIKDFSQLHYFTKNGELLSGYITSDFYRMMWDRARAQKF
jgi:glutamate synthase domain-containing protein 2